MTFSWQDRYIIQGVGNGLAYVLTHPQKQERPSTASLSSTTPAMLCRLPFTLLENVGLELAVLDPLGPPSDLIPLLCTCKHIYDWLSFDNNKALYARIFRCIFDGRAAVRRFGERCGRPSNVAQQLKVYCNTIRRIRGGDIAADPETVKEDMWTALMMMVDNDAKNAEQLKWARLGDFVDHFVRTKLREHCDQTFGWPPESEINALALWLLWFTTEQGEYHLRCARA